MTELPTIEPKQVINILLVEDHALTRMGLKTALKRTNDINVVGEAINGEEGITAARTLKPDVILMDVGMPIMDGVEAAKKIIGENPAVKVIMLTQHDNDQDILASLSAGASGYCLKDVEPERLYTAIRSVKNGDVWLDATIASRVLRYYTVQERPNKRSIEQNIPISATGSTSPAPVSTETKRLPENPFIEALSARELEVLRLIVDGLSNQEIADKLIISLATAKTHVRNILNKLAVDDRTQAAVQAMRRGLV
jgi:NarL family two-component system response regulator LiaR